MSQSSLIYNQVFEDKDLFKATKCNIISDKTYFLFLTSDQFPIKSELESIPTKMTHILSPWCVVVDPDVLSIMLLGLELFFRAAPLPPALQARLRTMMILWPCSTFRWLWWSWLWWWFDHVFFMAPPRALQGQFMIMTAMMVVMHDFMNFEHYGYQSGSPTHLLLDI